MLLTQSSCANFYKIYCYMFMVIIINYFAKFLVPNISQRNYGLVVRGG